MALIRISILLLFGALLPFDPGLASEVVLVIRDEPLMAGPSSESGRVSVVKAGTRLNVLRRSGSWYNVRTPGISGSEGSWISLFAVRMPLPERSQEKDRVRVKTRSAVMGVRGLSEVDLQQATPDYSQLEILDRYFADSGDLEGFDVFGDDRLRAVLLPTGGTSAPSEVSEEERRKQENLDRVEAEMGREVAAGLLGAASLVDDHRVQQYVNRVGRWVARWSDRPDLNWRFGVIRSDSLNAFAVPGGYVFVTMGLYQKLESESELAGVLAHEIAHIVQRHHLTLMMTAKAMESAVKQVRKVRLAKKAFQAALQKMVVLGCGVFTQALDQGSEIAADQIGMSLTADAGYDAFGLPRVVQVLQAETGGRATELIRKTHPAPEKRLEAFMEFAGPRISAMTNRSLFQARFLKHSLKHVRLVREQ